MPAYYPKFGSLLNSFLSERSISNAELARRSGIDETSISRWITNGWRPKTPEAILKIVSVLELDNDKRDKLLIAADYQEMARYLSLIDSGHKSGEKNDSEQVVIVVEDDDVEEIVIRRMRGKKRVIIQWATGIIILAIIMTFLLPYRHQIIDTARRIFFQLLPVPQVPGVPPGPPPRSLTVSPTATEGTTLTPTATVTRTPTPPATDAPPSPTSEPQANSAPTLTAVAAATATAQQSAIEVAVNATLTAMPAASPAPPVTRPATATAARPKPTATRTATATPIPPTATPTQTFTPLPTNTPTETETTVPPTATPSPVIATIPPTATATPLPVELPTPPKVRLVDPSEGRVYKTSSKSITFDWTTVAEPAGAKRYYEIIIQNINADPAHPTFPQGVNNLTASEYRPQISKAFAQSRGLHRWHVRVRFLANGQEVVGEWSEWRTFRVDE